MASWSSRLCALSTRSAMFASVTGTLRPADLDFGVATAPTNAILRTSVTSSAARLVAIPSLSFARSADPERTGHQPPAQVIVGQRCAGALGGGACLRVVDRRGRHFTAPARQLAEQSIRLPRTAQIADALGQRDTFAQARLGLVGELQPEQRRPTQ